jgi:hypothetical protein
VLESRSARGPSVLSLKLWEQVAGLVRMFYQEAEHANWSSETAVGVE